MKHLNKLVSEFVKDDIVVLSIDLTVKEALEVVRAKAPKGAIIYFYVVDNKERLVGMVSARDMLTASEDDLIKDLYSNKIVSIKENETVYDACELFLSHKFLALPVVDKQGHIKGMLDISLFTEDITDLSNRKYSDDAFELIGFKVEQVQNATAFKVWRYRFPWLLSTIISGMLCALLAQQFESTLVKSIVLAFFLTLVLALGESVSVQSMTVTIKQLQYSNLTFKWFFNAFRKEVNSSLLLAISCSLAVLFVIALWMGFSVSIYVIAFSIMLSVLNASLVGFTIPTFLHGLKLDPKLASGPLTLAITDVCTLLIYFISAEIFL
ncbi:MAG TPA: CBS domain-containing protein [Candidatus Kapabacteria bacterium]|mgnify:CR=1 FL=1|nr:CBS domain-containing protein [Candidatus Kapabacteria bacterium]